MQDADSEGEEGKYYLWTSEEIVGILAKEAYRNAEEIEEINKCIKNIPSNSTVRIVQGPTEVYPMPKEGINYYVCENQSCLPPMNQAEFLKHQNAQKQAPERLL